MTQEVLLFSVLRQRLGTPRITIAVEEGISGADLLDQLSEQYPALAPYRSMIRLAVNQEYVSETITLSGRDEIALITPVSGG
jgi:molybdopterin converting factor subunit 1